MSKPITYRVVLREVLLHLSEGAEATLHHTEYDIIRIRDSHIARRGVCPSRVDQLCEELNELAAARLGWRYDAPINYGGLTL